MKTANRIFFGYIHMIIEKKNDDKIHFIQFGQETTLYNFACNRCRYVCMYMTM